MANPRFLLCFLVLSAALANPISCARQFKKEEGHVPLFVLGDSLFDAGNNQYLNGSRKGGETSYPYGESFFNPPTGRLSDGRLVPDFIAQFGKLPVTTAYLKPGVHQFMVGSNFASAGSGVLDQTHPGTINLRTQLSDMKEVEKVLRQKLGDVETKRLLMRAVYLFSAGGNDYFDFFSKNPDAPQSYQQQYVNMVVGNLSQVLQEVYNMGGRKIAFQNAGPLGCLPAMKAMNPKLGSNCAEEPSSLSRLHNAALSNALKKLQTQLPGFRYSIFDYYNSLSERINNPSKYGFKEGKVACCGIGPYRGFGCGGKLEGKGNDYELCSNPSEYVWFDGGHTTERANLQLAELLWNGAPGVTGPCNLRELFGRL